MKKEIVLIKKRGAHCPFCDVKAKIKKSGVVIACEHCKIVVPAGSKFVYTFRKTIKPPRYTKVGRMLKRAVDKKMLAEIHKKVDKVDSTQQIEEKALVDSFLQDKATTVRETKKTKRYYGDVSDYLNTRKWKSKITKLQKMIDVVRQSGEGKLGPYRRQIKEIKRKMREAKRQNLKRGE